MNESEWKRLAMQRRAAFRTALVLAILTVVTSTTSWGQNPAKAPAKPEHQKEVDSRLEDVYELWAHRRAKIQSISFEISGTALQTAGSLANPGDMEFQGDPTFPETGFPERDTEFPVTIDWLADFAGNRMRYESAEMIFMSTERAYNPYWRLVVYDGADLIEYRPHERNSSDIYTPPPTTAEIVYKKTNVPNLLFHGYDLPVFHTVGCSRPVTDEAGKIQFVPITDLVLKEEVIFQETPCLHLVQGDIQKRAKALYVALEMGGAVLGFRNYNQGKVVEELNVSHQLHENMWLPSSWTYLISTGAAQDGHPYLNRRELKVGRVTVNPPVPDDTFTVPMKPGTIVRRQGEPRKRFVVENDGKSLAVLNLLERSEPKKPDAKPGHLFLWINVTIVALLCVSAALWRSRSNRRSTPHS